MDTAPLTSHQVLDPSYWFDLMYRFFYWLFTFLFRPETWDGLQVPLTLLSIFFISIILYCIIRLFEIRKKEHAHLEHEIHEYAESQREKEKLKLEKESVSHNEHWRQVLTYLFSEDTSSWKLAIMEADVMLDILMGQLGFKGEGLGEKLKMADQDTFRQLSRAWEVHTIRNRIAHEGLAFDLSQHEAKRVIAIYEQIFHEFGYI
ncbi:MAG TPA: hypothetical protein VJB95_01545 [Candidatus Paceibacterota bacterium]